MIDGRIALVGGHCIVDRRWVAGPDGPQFHDIAVRLEGPAVHAVQSAFSENWVAETGELFVGREVFPPLAPTGPTPVHVARIKPERAAPAVKILHHLVLCAARRRPWSRNPYFLPQAAAIEALAQAVLRGVDVRVMLPSARASDLAMVQHAAHRNFERLLEAGVRVYEYLPTLIHQKTMTVDGRWRAIGSSNFDDRSFEINDERPEQHQHRRQRGPAAHQSRRQQGVLQHAIDGEEEREHQQVLVAEAGAAGRALCIGGR